MRCRRHWPALPVIAVLCLSLPAAAADHPKPQWTLINPYPASGAVDIAGSTVATRVLRTMQKHVNPSVTDAVARAAQQAMVRSFDAEVTLVRQSRANGQAAAEAVSRCKQCLVIAGSGLASTDSAAVLGSLSPVALLARMPTVWVARSGSVLTADGRHSLRIGLPVERGAAAAWLRVMRGENGLRSAITYNGGHGALRAVMAGEVMTALVPLPAALPYLINGRVQAIALDAAGRHPLLPRLPAAGEIGLPQSGAGACYGLFSGAAGAVTASQAGALRAALQSADFAETVSGLGFFAADGATDGLQQCAQREFGMAGSADSRSGSGVQSRISSGGFTDRNSASRDRS